MEEHDFAATACVATLSRIPLSIWNAAPQSAKHAYIVSGGKHVLFKPDVIRNREVAWQQSMWIRERDDLDDGGTFVAHCNDGAESLA